MRNSLIWTITKNHAGGSEYDWRPTISEACMWYCFCLNNKSNVRNFVALLPLLHYYLFIDLFAWVGDEMYECELLSGVDKTGNC